MSTERRTLENPPNLRTHGWLVGLVGLIFRCSRFDQAFAASVVSASFVISTIAWPESSLRNSCPELT